MVILVDRNGSAHDIKLQIEKAEAVLTDLKRLANRQFPTSAELEVAPLIEEYQIAPRSLPAFSGRAYGPPRLSSPIVLTRDLLTIHHSPNGREARRDRAY